MSRSELLELLLDQAETNRLLQKELDELTKKLNQKEIIINNAGSIAEASLQLNGVFDAAQKAIQQYVDNVKKQWSQQEEMCNRIIDEAQRKADNIIAEAEEYARHIRSGADNTSADTSDKKQEDTIEKSADQIKESSTKDTEKSKSNNTSTENRQKGSGRGAKKAAGNRKGKHKKK